MNAHFRRLTRSLISIAIVAGAIAACSSSGVQTDKVEGDATSGSTESATNASATSAGGADTTSASATATTGTRDPTCNSTLAKTGAACSQDCIIPCGYADLGTKTCTCGADGTFSACPCPRPPAYLGGPTAPFCNDAVNFPAATETGLMDTLKGLPCTEEFMQCIARDLDPSSDTPRGCSCLTHPIEGNLQWYCGSTNKWFGVQR